MTLLTKSMPESRTKNPGRVRWPKHRREMAALKRLPLRPTPSDVLSRIAGSGPGDGPRSGSTTRSAGG